MDQNSLQQEERDWYSKALIEKKSEALKKKTKTLQKTRSGNYV